MTVKFSVMAFSVEKKNVFSKISFQHLKLFISFKAKCWACFKDTVATELPVLLSAGAERGAGGTESVLFTEVGQGRSVPTV